MATIRSGIGDIVNDLNKAQRTITDPFVQIEIQKVIEQLFVLWRLTIIEEMEKTSQDYKTALEKIKVAKADAKAAVKKMEKVKDAIKSANAVAKAVDKIIKVAIKLI